MRLLVISLNTNSLFLAFGGPGFRGLRNLAQNLMLGLLDRSRHGVEHGKVELLGELPSSLGKALAKGCMHFVEHNVGSVIKFHSSEKYVGSFSHPFVLTHQVF